MTSPEEHKKKIREHLDEIEDAIDEGLEKKPATIGFHSSACAIQFLELYLHIKNKISMGKVVKHDWFKRPKPEQKVDPLVDRKISVEFPKKREIYDLIYNLEEERNTLVYGKASKEQVVKVLDSFQKLKEIFLELLENENFQI